MGTAIQYVFPAPVGPDAHRLEAIDEGHQRRDGVYHSGVDDLSPAGFRGFQQAANDAEGEV